MRENTLKVGYVFHYGLGDSLMILPALYELKAVYGAFVVVFGNKILGNLLQNADFIDEFIDIGSELCEDSIAKINSFRLDFVILANPKTRFVRLLESSNAKTIITETKLYSLICPRCKTVPICIFYRHYNQYQRHRALVSRINSTIYKRKIKNINSYKGSMLRIKNENEAFIQGFLDKLNTSKTLESRAVFIAPPRETQLRNII